jgi:hypothetical protein
MLDIPLDLHDLEDFDPEMFNSMKYMLENDNVQDIGSYFVQTVSYFDKQIDYNLIPGGADILVTDQNKREYVQKVAQF